MWEKSLELASHVTHPGTIALFTAILTAYLCSITIRKKRSPVTWLLAAIILISGIAPLISSTYLQARGLYRLRAFVLGTDGQPDEAASVTISTGGERKKVQGGWEFDIPPQIKPIDGKVILFASVKSDFLVGKSDLVLAQNYYPTTTIQLTADTSAVIRGTVVDARGRSVVAANVSIVGFPNTATTDAMGNFVLAAHAADGQIVQLRAQKGGLVGSISAPAGSLPVEVMLKN
jgi:hypothetical protein